MAILSPNREGLRVNDSNARNFQKRERCKYPRVTEASDAKALNPERESLHRDSILARQEDKIA
jgi:hypothetical protein